MYSRRLQSLFVAMSVSMLLLADPPVETAPTAHTAPDQRPKVTEIDWRLPSKTCFPPFELDSRFFVEPGLAPLLEALEQAQRAKEQAMREKIGDEAMFRERLADRAASADAQVLDWSLFFYHYGNVAIPNAPSTRRYGLIAKVDEEIAKRRSEPESSLSTIAGYPPVETRGVRDQVNWEDLIRHSEKLEQTIGKLVPEFFGETDLSRDGLVAIRAWIETRGKTPFDFTAFSYAQVTLLKEFLLNKFEEESALRVEEERANGSLPFSFQTPRPMSEEERWKALERERLLACVNVKPAHHRRAWNDHVSNFVARKGLARHGLPLAMRHMLESNLRGRRVTMDDGARHDLDTTLTSLIADRAARPPEEADELYYNPQDLAEVLYRGPMTDPAHVLEQTQRRLDDPAAAQRVERLQGAETAHRFNEVLRLAYGLGAHGRQLTPEELEDLKLLRPAEFDRLYQIILSLGGVEEDTNVFKAALRNIVDFWTGHGADPGKYPSLAKALTLPGRNRSLDLDPARLTHLEFFPEPAEHASQETRDWVDRANGAILDHALNDFESNSHFYTVGRIVDYFGEYYRERYGESIDSVFCAAEPCTEEERSKRASSELTNAVWRMLRMEKLARQYPDVPEPVPLGITPEATRLAQLLHEHKLIERHLSELRAEQRKCSEHNETCRLKEISSEITWQYRRLWSDHTREIERLRQRQSALTGADANLAPSLALLIDAHEQIRAELSHDAFAHLSRHTRERAGLGEKVDIEYMCAAGKIYHIRGVPEELTASPQLYREWLESDLIDRVLERTYPDDAEKRRRAKKHDFDDNFTARQVSDDIMASIDPRGWYSLNSLTGRKTIQGSLIRESIGAKHCAPDNAWQTLGYITWARDVFHLRPSYLNGDVRLLQDLLFEYYYGLEGKDERVFIRYQDAPPEVRTAVSRIQQFRDDWVQRIGDIPPREREREMVRKYGKFTGDFRPMLDGEIGEYVRAYVKGLSEGTPEQRDLYRSLQTYFSHWPKDNAWRRWVLGPSLPGHLTAHEKDEEILNLWSEMSAASREAEHALFEHGIRTGQESRDELVAILKDEVARHRAMLGDSGDPVERAAELPDQTPGSFADAPRIFVEDAIAVILKPSIEKPDEALDILSDPNLSFHKIEELEKNSPDIVHALQQARNYFLLNLLKVEKMLGGEDLKGLAPLDKRLASLVGGDEKKLAVLGHGLSTIILRIDNYLASKDPGVFDPAYPDPGSEALLVRELDLLESHMRQANPRDLAKFETHTNGLETGRYRMSLPYSGKASSPQELPGDVQFLGLENCDWFLRFLSEESRGSLTDEETDHPYMGLPPRARTAILSLPIVLRKYLVEELCAHNWSIDFGQTRRSRLILDGFSGGEEFEELITELIHNPWPARILHTMAYDRDGKALFRRYLGGVIAARKYELVRKRAGDDLAPGETPPSADEVARELEILELMDGTRADLPVWKMGLSFMLDTIRNGDPEERERIRDWAMTKLLSFYPNVDDLKRLSPDALLKLAANDDAAKNQDNPGAKDLLVLVISLIDEAGDGETGTTAAGMELAKGGILRFNPIVVAGLGARERDLLPKTQIDLGLAKTPKYQLVSAAQSAQEWRIARDREHRAVPQRGTGSRTAGFGTPASSPRPLTEGERFLEMAFGNMNGTPHFTYRDVMENLDDARQRERYRKLLDQHFVSFFLEDPNRDQLITSQKMSSSDPVGLLHYYRSIAENGKGSRGYTEGDIKALQVMVAMHDALTEGPEAAPDEPDPADDYTAAQRNFFTVLDQLHDSAEGAPKGLSGRQRVRVLGLAPDVSGRLVDLHELTHGDTLKDQGIRHADEVWRQVAQAGGEEDIRRASFILNPNGDRFSELSKIDETAYREALRADIADDGQISDENAGKLLTLARAQLYTKWLPSRIEAMLTNESHEDYQSLLRALQEDIARELPQFVDQVEEGLRQDVAIRLMNEYRAELRDQYDGTSDDPDVQARAALRAQDTLNKLSELVGYRLADFLPSDEANRTLLVDHAEFLGKLERALDTDLVDEHLDLLKGQVAAAKDESPGYASVLEGHFIPAFREKVAELKKKHGDDLSGSQIITRAWSDLLADPKFADHVDDLESDRDFVHVRASNHVDERALVEVAELDLCSNETLNFAGIADQAWVAWQKEEAERKEQTLSSAARQKWKEFKDRSTRLRTIMATERARHLRTLRDALHEREMVAKAVQTREEYMTTAAWRDPEKITPEQKRDFIRALDLVRENLRARQETVNNLLREQQEMAELWRKQEEALETEEQQLVKDLPGQLSAELGFDPHDRETFIRNHVLENFPTVVSRRAQDILTSAVGRYFGWRERAELLGKVLAESDGNWRNDPRFVGLSASVEACQDGYRLSRAESERIVGAVLGPERARVARRKQILDELSQWGIFWDGVAIDFSGFNVKDKPLTQEKLKSLLDELGQYLPKVGAGTAAAYLGIDSDETPWDQFRATLIAKWQTEGAPGVLEWYDMEKNDPDEPVLGVAIYVTEKDGVFSFQFRDLQGERETAQKVADRLREKVNSNVTDLRELRRIENGVLPGAIQRMYFDSRPYHAKIGENVAEIKDLMEELRKYGNLAVKLDEDTGALPADVVAQHFGLEYKHHVRADIENTRRNIQADHAWRDLTWAVFLGTLPFNFVLPHGTLAYGMVHGGSMGMGLHLVGAAMDTNVIPLFGFKPSGSNWSERGPATLKAGLTFAGGSGIGYGLGAYVNAGGLGTGWVTRLLSAETAATAPILSWTGAARIMASPTTHSLSGILFSTAGLEVASDYFNAQANDYDFSLLGSLGKGGAHGVQNAVYMLGIDQRAAAFLKQGWQRLAASVGVNQIMTAGLTAWDVRKQRNNLLAQRELAEKLGDDARVDELDKALEELDYLSTIARANFTELPAHIFFGNMARKYGAPAAWAAELRGVMDPKKANVDVLQRVRERIDHDHRNGAIAGAKWVARQIPGLRNWKVVQPKDISASMVDAQLLQVISGLPAYQLDGIRKAARDNPGGQAAEVLRMHAEAMAITPARFNQAFEELKSSGKYKPTLPLHEKSQESVFREIVERQIRDDLATARKSSAPQGSRSIESVVAELARLVPEAYEEYPLDAIMTSIKQTGTVSPDQQAILAAAAHSYGIGDPSGLTTLLSRARFKPGSSVSWEGAMDFLTASHPSRPVEQHALLVSGTISPELVRDVWGKDIYEQTVRQYVILDNRSVSPTAVIDALRREQSADPTVTFFDVYQRMLQQANNGP